MKNTQRQIYIDILTKDFYNLGKNVIREHHITFTVLAKGNSSPEAAKDLIKLIESMFPWVKET